MPRHADKRSWRPDAEGRLLLAAALGGRADAPAAWRAWSAQRQVADLSPGARRLLPLIHDNLQQHGFEDDVEGISGVAGEALAAMWCETQLLFHETSKVLAALEQEQIPTLLLKGGAHALLDYPDLSLRPMADLDILISPDHVSRAMTLLRDTGWKSAHAAPEILFPFQHGASFSNGRAGAVDLHWRVLWRGRLMPGHDASFWNRSVGVTLEGVSTRALAAEDRLLHACVHGMEWTAVLPIRWVPDVVMLVRHHGPRLDWDYVVEEACRRRLAPAIAEALDYVDEYCDGAVPARAHARLRQASTSPVSRVAHHFRSGRKSIYLALLNDWWIGWRTYGPAPFRRKAAHFMKYFTLFRGAASRTSG